MVDEPNKPLVCGVVMPISAIDGLLESHWLDVRSILVDAIKTAGFEPNLVSDADDVGIIQKRIIQNLYDNPIVVADVSAKNPNVMFELGLRLAFDKPTIIVKDDKTSYSFDTASIEHLQYPRDLRFAHIVAFKAQLSDKIKGTYKKATEDQTYTTFLKHFGQFTVAKLEEKEVSGQEYILEEIKSLRGSMTRLERTIGSVEDITLKDIKSVVVDATSLSGEHFAIMLEIARTFPGAKVQRLGVAGQRITLTFEPTVTWSMIENTMSTLKKSFPEINFFTS
jgi:hypothetical protein